ncbi:MAG: ABC transporter permease, partial [Nitrososphaerales archaeon]
MKLYEYALRRVILLVFVLVAVSVIVFFITRAFLSPTYAVSAFLTPRMTDPEKLQTAQSIGVATLSCPSWQSLVANQPGCAVPVYEQYFSWLTNVLHGNWGYSQIPQIGVGTSAWAVFSARFPLTVELALVASLLILIIALPLGIVSAVHSNKAPDHAARIVALTGYSMPLYWLGWILQIVFVLYLTIQVGAFKYGLFPAAGPSAGVVGSFCYLCISNAGNAVAYTGIPVVDGLLSGNLVYAWDALVAVFLPALTLCVGIIGALTRIVRSSMVEALRQDYVILARSKGLKERTVIYRHALKNALLPAITITGLIFAALLGGAVIVEDVFSWPGVGVAALNAALFLDVNFLELYTLVVA